MSLGRHWTSYSSPIYIRWYFTGMVYYELWWIGKESVEILSCISAECFSNHITNQLFPFIIIIIIIITIIIIIIIIIVSYIFHLACQEIGCNAIYNENCTSGCPDGYSCKRDFCNCSDSCQRKYFNHLKHNVPKWSDTLQKSCSKCCKIFKVCLTILAHYALKV